MRDVLNEWLGHPFTGMLAPLGLCLMVYLAWRQYRDRERRRYYRQRERARREYWGFD